MMTVLILLWFAGTAYALLCTGNLVTGFLNAVIWFVMVGIFLAWMITPAKPDTVWKKSPYETNTWRSDKGEVWKKSPYEYETWRSNDGKVCKTDRYGGAVRCSK